MLLFQFLDIVQRSNRHESLTPEERALLRFIDLGFLAILTAAAPVILAAITTHSLSSISWRDVIGNAAAAGFVALWATWQKYNNAKTEAQNGVGVSSSSSSASPASDPVSALPPELGPVAVSNLIIPGPSIKNPDDPNATAPVLSVLSAGPVVTKYHDNNPSPSVPESLAQDGERATIAPVPQAFEPVHVDEMPTLPVVPVPTDTEVKAQEVRSENTPDQQPT